MPVSVRVTEAIGESRAIVRAVAVAIEEHRAGQRARGLAEVVAGAAAPGRDGMMLAMEFGVVLQNPTAESP